MATFSKTQTDEHPPQSNMTSFDQQVVGMQRVSNVAASFQARKLCSRNFNGTNSAAIGPGVSLLNVAASVEVGYRSLLHFGHLEIGK